MTTTGEYCPAQEGQLTLSIAMEPEVWNRGSEQPSLMSRNHSNMVVSQNRGTLRIVGLLINKKSMGGEITTMWMQFSLLRVVTLV